MKFTFELDDANHILFAQLLASEARCALDIEEYVLHLLYREMRKHPAMRFCANPKCELLALPSITVTPKKYVPNSACRSSIMATPVTVCPECGGPVVEYDGGAADAEEA